MKIKWKKKGYYIDVKFENPYNNYNLRKIIYHQYLSIFVGFFALMGAQLERLRYEVFQNLFYSPINTGILRAAVATAPTVYGIETLFTISSLLACLLFSCNSTYRLRYWNYQFVGLPSKSQAVATAPTVYGIETSIFFGHF